MGRKPKISADAPNLFTEIGASENISVIQETFRAPYLAASQKRSLREWLASYTTADGALLPHANTLRARSYDSVRNQPAATGAIKTLKTGVVGSGLRLQPSIDRDFLKMSEEEAQIWQAKTKQEFRLWAENSLCDFSKQLTFYGLQRLAFGAQLISGDCFALLPLKPFPGMIYDLRVQLIEADRVCNPDGLPDSEKIAGGIERDADGVAFAIHIRTPHPYSYAMNTTQAVWQRVPIYGRKTGIKNVLHLMEVERIGQSRGVTILAPVIEPLKQISDYSSAELSAAVVNAMLTVGVERPLEDSTGTLLYPDEDEKGNAIEYPWQKPGNYQLGAGTWVDLAPGEKLNMINAARPSSQYDPFFSACVKQVGMGLSIPYEVLMKLYSSSYSASRAAMLEFHKYALVIRDDFEVAFSQPIYETFLIEAVSKGRIIAPGFLTDPYRRFAFSGAYWMGPAQGQIDEVKEVNAANLRVKYGFSTKQAETQKLTGMDYRDVMRIQAEEKNYAESLGLTYEATMPGAAPRETNNNSNEDGNNGNNGIQNEEETSG